MTHQTVVLSNIDHYLCCGGDSDHERAELLELRQQQLSRFPHSVMLQVAFPELDFINRWCWLSFGPRDGDCTQKDSEYRVCHSEPPHSHEGVWTDRWFTKTDYNFGFNEWYFANKLNCDTFIQHISSFNWGEHFPK